MNDKKLNLLYVLAWLVGAATGVTVFAYSTFETKDAAKDRADSISARLDRIETKVDSLLERASK